MNLGRFDGPVCMAAPASQVMCFITGITDVPAVLQLIEHINSKDYQRVLICFIEEHVKSIDYWQRSSMCMLVCGNALGQKH